MASRHVLASTAFLLLFIVTFTENENSQIVIYNLVMICICKSFYWYTYLQIICKSKNSTVPSLCTKYINLFRMYYGGIMNKQRLDAHIFSKNWTILIMSFQVCYIHARHNTKPRYAILTSLGKSEIFRLLYNCQITLLVIDLNVFSFIHYYFCYLYLWIKIFVWKLHLLYIICMHKEFLYAYMPDYINLN